MLQYGYGGYGLSMRSGLSHRRVPAARPRHGLCDRAYPRRRRKWAAPGMTHGQLLQQEEHLHRLHRRHRATSSRNGYAAKDRVAASGGSAGGLLMGAIANMAPQDYRVHRHPRAVRRRGHDHARCVDPAHHQRIRRVGQSGGAAVLRLHAVVFAVRQRQRARPIRRCSSAPACGTARCNITSRPNRSRKLRATKTDTNPLVFRINMEAGHGGKSGRFEQYRSRAEYYAFMLWQLGCRGAGTRSSSTGHSPAPRSNGAEPERFVGAR